MTGRADDERSALEAKHGKVWTEGELREEFTILGTMTPFVIERRRSDRKLGSVESTGSPPFYFDFKEDE